MKKIFLIAVSFVSILSVCNAQDIITKKSGEDIKAKILEVNQTEVKYKRFDNSNGPTFTILKSELLMVRYENGTKDIFKEVEEKVEKKSTSTDLISKAKQDAKINYKGQNSGAGWTTATSIVLSPLFGLIPAIACSTSEPNESNLNYKEAELMKDNQYNQTFREEAHKIKKRKIWKNFAIGSAVWIAVVLLF
jgi:hypothetical protein